MIGLANRRTRATVAALTVSASLPSPPDDGSGPRYVSGVCLPLLRSERGLAFENIGEGALAGGNGRLERRAGPYVHVDQGHRPGRRMREDDVAELAGVDARLHSIPRMNRRSYCRMS